MPLRIRVRTSWTPSNGEAQRTTPATPPQASHSTSRGIQYMHHSTPLQVPYPFPISPPGSTISTVSIKLDPVQHLPPELCLHILSFIHDPKTLTACCAVNRAWKELLQDEEIWRTVVRRFGYAPSDRGSNTSRPPGEEDENILLSRGVKEILKREFSIDSNWHAFGLRGFNFGNDATSSILLQSHIQRFTATPSSRSVVQVQKRATLAVADRTGCFLAIGYGKFPTEVYDLRSGKLRHSLEGDTSCWALAFSERMDEDGRVHTLLVTGGTFKIINVYDLTSQTFLYAINGHANTIRSLIVIPSRTSTPNAPQFIVTASRDWTVRVWNLSDGEYARQMDGHSDNVKCLVSIDEEVEYRDGRSMLRVVSGSNDHTARIWNVLDGECLHVLSGHVQPIQCIAVDKMKAILCLGSHDSIITVWNLESGACLSAIVSHTSQIFSLHLVSYPSAPSPPSPASLPSNDNPMSIDLSPPQNTSIRTLLLSLAGDEQVFQHDLSDAYAPVSKRILVPSSSSFDFTGPFARERDTRATAMHLGHGYLVMADSTNSGLLNVFAVGPQRRSFQALARAYPGPGLPLLTGLQGAEVEPNLIRTILARDLIADTSVLVAARDRLVVTSTDKTGRACVFVYGFGGPSKGRNRGQHGWTLLEN